MFKGITVRLSVGLALMLSSRGYGAQQETSSIAAQLSSVERQRISIRTQRESVGKQLATVHLAAKQAFVEGMSVSLPESCPMLPFEEAETLIDTAARTESISPDLLRAVIRRESAFRPCAVSEKGAQGLMQLMPATSAALHVANPFDAKQNVLGGAAYLRQLMDRYRGDASLALSAYNAGPQQVDRSEGIPQIPETQNYVAAILGELGLALPSRQETAESKESDAINSDGPSQENAIHNVVLQLSLGSLALKPTSVRLEAQP